MKNYLNLFESSVYAFDGKDSIFEEKDIGICADIASMLTPESSVCAMKGFQGCPYTNTGFNFDIRIDGEIIKSKNWKWLPCAILRTGATANIAVSTLTAVIPKTRTVVQKVICTNLKDEDITAPIAIMYRGRARKEQKWTFSIPSPLPTQGFGSYLPRENYTYENGILSLSENGAAYRITSSLENLTFFERAYILESEISIPKNGEFVFYVSAHMGDEEKSLEEAKYTQNRYEKCIEDSFDYLETEIKRIHDNLPRLSSSCAELDNLYYRSLVTYMLCRWENPELCAQPYYSTGSINGACMCSYLWDYCGGLMLHPVYDFEGNKVQLRAYLRNDLTKSYALNPVTSEGVGPWYQVNQEKIILMVYHHVRATMDKDFLLERVGDKTVIEWMKYHAYVCDDLTRDVELYDYGVGGDDHLELMNWGNGPYNGIMPDLNARRYMNYMRVYELTCIAGEPDERLPKRAAALKEKLKTLWNDDIKWYDFIDANGNKDVRYTVQMFKFLASGVIGEKEREGLVSHLNDREFLSKFGLHSISKLDPQYDQDDIDNGGGGSCTHFVMQICAQLYETGYDSLATDILKRVLWWGERLPFLSDSCLANMALNKDHSDLQGDISSVSAAQMIFYYIFGIRPAFDGSIKISPVKNRPADSMKVENVRLCGKVFSVSISGDTFTVSVDGKSYNATIGTSIKI